MRYPGHSIKIPIIPIIQGFSDVLFPTPLVLGGHIDGLPDHPTRGPLDNHLPEVGQNI